MIVTTTDAVPGKKVKQVLGIVKGNTIRSRWFGSDIVAALKNLVGGEIKGYTQLLTEAREEAHRRMVEQAKKMGADAIVNVRYATSHIMANAAEMVAYGTAIKLE